MTAWYSRERSSFSSSISFFRSNLFAIGIFPSRKQRSCARAKDIDGKANREGAKARILPTNECDLPCGGVARAAQPPGRFAATFVPPPAALAWQTQSSDAGACRKARPAQARPEPT